MDRIIAIDPGASGGIACLFDGVLEVHRMPKTDEGIVTFFSHLARFDVPAYLEALVKYTGVNMPSSAMATYAGNEAFVRGVLKALKFDVQVVQPKAWQAAVGMKREKKEPKGQWKNRLKSRAQELYPAAAVTLLTADALLILHAASQGLI